MFESVVYKNDVLDMCKNGVIDGYYIVLSQSLQDQNQRVWKKNSPQTLTYAQHINHHMTIDLAII